MLVWSRKLTLKFRMSWAPSTWAVAWMVRDGAPPGKVPVVVELNRVEPNAGLMPALNRAFRVDAKRAASTAGAEKGVE